MITSSLYCSSENNEEPECLVFIEEKLVLLLLYVLDLDSPMIFKFSSHFVL